MYAIRSYYADCPNVKNCIVIKRTGGKIDWKEGRDVWYHELQEKASVDCPPEEMDAEDPRITSYNVCYTKLLRG